MDAPPRSTPNSASMVGRTTTLDHKPTPPLVASASTAANRRQAVPLSSSALMVLAFMSYGADRVRTRTELPDQSSRRNHWIVSILPLDRAYPSKPAQPSDDLVTAKGRHDQELTLISRGR